MRYCDVDYVLEAANAHALAHSAAMEVSMHAKIVHVHLHLDTT
jgi:hypothetical protein